MDRKAVQILENVFWSSSGWRRERLISDADREYATIHGCWYPNAVVNHDQEIRRLIALVREIDRKRLSKNFLASLSTRNLHIRSGLGSFAAHLHLTPHKKTNDIHCRICGAVDVDSDFDRNVLNFERIKWGGVRHHQPFYAAFDLESTKELTFEPTSEDIQIFQEIISTIVRVPPEKRIRDVEKAISKILKSNKAEREVLLQILGYCGIIQPLGRPSFFSGFVPVSRRTEPPVSKIDWTYPVGWWRGSDGIDREALAYYFDGFIGMNFV